MPGHDHHEIERLLATERAAELAGDTAAQWWQEIAASAAMARSEGALNALFRRALMTLKDMLGADALAVLVANDSGDELLARAATGLSEEMSLGLGIRAGQGMAGTVIATRAPLIVDDLSQIEVATDALRNSGLSSVVAVPLLFEDHLLGVLYAGSRERAHFTGVDADLLQVIASRLSTAIERVRAFEAEHAARLRAQRDADRLERLQDFTAKLVRESDPERIAAVLGTSLAVDSAGRDVASTAVWLVDGADLQLTSSTPGTLDILPVRLPVVGDSALSRVAVECRAQFGAGVDRNPFGRTPSPEGSSWALLPLVVDADSVGVVAVAYPGPQDIAPEEQEFLASMVEQAAQAMHRSQLRAQEVALGELATFLAQAAKVIAEASDFAGTLDRLAELALGAIGDICLIDFLQEDGALRRMVARHRDRSKQHLVDRLGSDYPPDATGAHPAVEVIRTGATRWSRTMSDDFLRATTRDETHLALVHELEFHSYLSVPLVGSRMLGSLTLVSGSRSFDADDVRFAERLAEQVAAVVDNAQRYESTLRTSQVLQQSLLPQRLVSVPGLEVATRYLPATRGLEVGGDFYDLILLDDAAAVFMVGDVEGHDRDAAALMGHLRSAARALAGHVKAPGQLIEALQQSWSHLDFDRIATALFGWFTVRTGELVLASAGHYPPLLLGAGGAEFLAVQPGPPLGVGATAGGPDWFGALDPGDALLVYTDGAIDERVLGAEASMELLAAGLTTPERLDAEAVCDRVIGLLPADRPDDVALLALRRRS
ncbi:MAG TPA: SpoIIE family protein phosphatase [Acidimicrobiales bacterium]